MNADVETRLQYRADVDGLRAIAVVPVVFFHAGVSLFGGGFVGVDVFFVISGYLITSLIHDEIISNRFSIVTFYARRVRRIFPALFAVFLFTLVVCYFIFWPNEFKTYGASLAAATLFSSNILFWRETGYFAAAAELKPLLHTWSLAVEEQFYLFFPLLLVVVARKFQGRWVATILPLMLISFAFSVWGAEHRPTPAFFLAPTRLWELFLGALLALRVFPPIRMGVVREILSLIGMLLIVWSMVAFTRNTPFPGINALLPTAGTALVIYCGQNHQPFLNRVLSLSPLVFVGLISYSLYLWHWPLLAGFRYYKDADLNAFEIAVIVAVSFVVAAASWKFIEQPIRYRKLFRNNKALFSAAFAAMVGFVVCGMIVYGTDGLPQRISTEKRAIIAANQATAEDWRYPEECGANFGRIYSEGTQLALCVLGPETEKKILFWGDSHIEQLYWALSKISKEPDVRRQIIMTTYGGCPPVTGLNREIKGLDCNGFNQRVFDRAMEGDIDVIVLGSVWSDYIGRVVDADECSQRHVCNEFKDERDYLAVITRNLVRALKAASDAGKKVHIILPFPAYNTSPVRYISKSLFYDRPMETLLTRTEHLARHASMNAALRSVAVSVGASVHDPSETLCPVLECLYQEKMVSLYRDKDHISPDASLKFVPMLSRIVNFGP